MNEPENTIHEFLRNPRGLNLGSGTVRPSSALGAQRSANG